jgi:hypothetical protein
MDLAQSIFTGFDDRRREFLVDKRPSVAGGRVKHEFQVQR